MYRDTNNPFNDNSQIFYAPLYENAQDVFSGNGRVTDLSGVTIPTADVRFMPGSYADVIDISRGTGDVTQQVVFDVYPGFLGYPSVPNSESVSYYILVTLTDEPVGGVFTMFSSHNIRIQNNVAGHIEVRCWGENNTTTRSSLNNPPGSYLVAVCYDSETEYTHLYIGPSSSGIYSLGPWDPSPASGITERFDVFNSWSGPGVPGVTVETIRVFNRYTTEEEYNIINSMTQHQVAPKVYPDTLNGPNYASASLNSADAATREVGLIAPYQVERFGAKPIVSLTFLMSNREDMRAFRDFYNLTCYEGMAVFKASWYIIDYNDYSFRFLERYTAKAVGFGRYVVTAKFEMLKPASNIEAEQLTFVVDDFFTSIVSNNGSFIITPTP